MAITLRLLVVWSLVFNANYAPASTKNEFNLAQFSQLVSGSRDVRDFIVKAFPNDEYRQKLFQDYAKKRDISQLPKASYADGVLTLVEINGDKVTMTLNGVGANEIKINGKIVKIGVQETLDTLSAKMELALANKTSFFEQLLWSEAHAIVYAVVILVLTVAGAIYIFKKANSCDEVAADYQKTIGKVAVKEVLACQQSTADIQASLSGSSDVHKLSIIKQEDEMFLAGVLQDQGPDQKTTKYSWSRADTQRETPLVLQSVEVNGEAITASNNPEKFKIYQESFNSFYPAVKNLTTERGTLSKSCVQCKDEINKELANPYKPGTINRILRRKKATE